ncbi:MAG: alpha/beta fold hydrolase [Rubrobacteraceae bacterium]
MTTFVLVPGACHGGWWFEPFARRLRRHGHEAYPLTLTGVGDRSHLLGASVNLETHIQDVISVLEAEQIEDAVLVGHSYGGAVITGVADRVSERVDALVYIDAFVPGDGDSCFDLTTDDQRQWYLEGAGADGYAVTPLPFFDSRATSHPLASLLQRIHLTGNLDRFRRRDYVYLSDWPEKSPFAQVYELLRQDPAWNVHILPTRHNFMAEASEEVFEILLRASAPAPH